MIFGFNTCGVVIVGVVNVLFVNVSVVALPTSVSVAAGSVTVTSAVAAGPCKRTLFVPLSVPSLKAIVPPATALVAEITGADIIGVVILGLVNVLFVNVSVVALPTKVSESAGSVIVTSAVAAGPWRRTRFVPLFVPSLNVIVPAAVALGEIVGLDITGVVNVLFVNVSVVALPTKVSVAAGSVIVASAVDAGP